MNTSRLSLFIFIGIFVLACSFPSFAATPPPATDTAEPTAAPAVDIATDTPAPPPNTATVAPPPTSSVPLASPDGQPVNCRSGPGLGWDPIVILQVGQSIEIVGKLTDNSWFQVKNSAIPGGFCWVSASVVRTSGDLSGVQLIAAPPTPIPPTLAAVVVTDVSVSISPTTISVPGCMGPIQPSVISATITVNGPIKLSWHFKTQQSGNLGTKSLNFNKADSKGVTQSFTPPLEPGTYSVTLVIDGANLSGMDTTAKYKIVCP